MADFESATCISYTHFLFLQEQQQQQQPFNGLCSRTTWVGRYQKTHCLLLLHRAVLHSGWVSPPPVFWIFMEQGKIMEAEVPTVRVGATRTGLTAPPTTLPPVFHRPDALPNGIKALKAFHIPNTFNSTRNSILLSPGEKTP